MLCDHSCVICDVLLNFWGHILYFNWVNLGICFFVYPVQIDWGKITLVYVTTSLTLHNISIMQNGIQK